MKKIATLFLVLLISVGANAQLPNLVKYVNTLQGSYNTAAFSHGRCTPLVGMPQGVSTWSPSQFNYVEQTVRGLGGSGISLAPLTAKEDLAQQPSYSFDTTSIVAKPHHFQITLSNGVVAQMVPTERCAAFLFSFPRKKEAFLLLDGKQYLNVHVDRNQNRITGTLPMRSSHYQVTDSLYFILQFDNPFVTTGTCEQGVYVSFTKGVKVQVLAAVSRISATQAQVTFDRELGSQSFAQVKEQAFQTWNKWLHKIEVEGGTEAQRSTFYSCFFKTLLRPSRNYEIDAQGNPHYAYNGRIYDGIYHSNPILWDAYRSLFALHNIINTAEQKQYVQSLLQTKPLTGWWPSGHVMIGNHAISVLADAWAKGIRTFNPETALAYYYDEITHSVLDSINNGEYNKEHERGFGRMGHEDYFALGYIPYPQNTDRVMETTSKTIEYNYDDFCAYQLALMTGNAFYARVFEKHIFNYRNVFDATDQFFKGRDRSGAFDTDFNPYEWGGPFVEGNGWQWRFAVQQDAQGMMDLMGGASGFLSNLNELFTVPSDSVLHGGYGYRIHEINEAVAGAQGQYAQGNEPCFHVMHLYAHAGQPWKAQQLLRESMVRLFNPGPKGFPGDEDGGAMSSWYVFNAMGFYPVTPGTPQYTLGSPLFSKITINLESGKQFIIEAPDNEASTVYIQQATLNGRPYTKSWIDHNTLMEGGKLTLRMSTQPNTQRGTSAADRPYSLSQTH